MGFVIGEFKMRQENFYLCRQKIVLQNIDYLFMVFDFYKMRMDEYTFFAA